MAAKMSVEAPEDRRLPLQAVVCCQRGCCKMLTHVSYKLAKSCHITLTLQPASLEPESIRLTTLILRYAGVWIPDDRHHRPDTLQRAQCHRDSQRQQGTSPQYHSCFAAPSSLPQAAVLLRDRSHVMQGAAIHLLLPCCQRCMLDLSNCTCTTGAAGDELCSCVAAGAADGDAECANLLHGRWQLHAGQRRLHRRLRQDVQRRHRRPHPRRVRYQIGCTPCSVAWSARVSWLQPLRSLRHRAAH